MTPRWNARWRAALAATIVALLVGAFLAGNALAQTPPAASGMGWTPPGMGMMWGPGGPGAGPCPMVGTGGQPGGPRHMLTAVADFLGITPEQLWAELPGKSLAQVAAAHQKSTAEVIAFFNREARAALDAAVKAGRLTQAQADRMHALHVQRVAQMVETVHPAAMGPGARQPGGPDRAPGNSPRPRR
jgi:hypothetical protein